MKDDLPKGFRAATVAAKFRNWNRDDLGLIFSDLPCVLAALFTRNIFCAAPVIVCKEILASGRTIRAVVANAGQANSCTGADGLKDCREIQEIAAKDLGVAPDEIALVSTGVIGARFDMAKWREALKKLSAGLGKQDAEGFTRSFMTTDAFPKFASRDIELSAGNVRLTVMAKGAGMICPDMATMLCVVLTDAAITREYWRKFFIKEVDASFNRVSVDGDTSTNDTILGLANGASGVELISDGDRELFRDELGQILKKVAYMLVQDGEGSSKVIHIDIEGAADEAAAKKAARAVAGSQLVKTAIYGGDANWGRIINAVGYSGVDVRPDEVGLYLCGIERFRDGVPVNDNMEAELAEKLKERDISVRIILGKGDGKYSMLSSDLGREYVTLNSDYRS
ncbi:MAG: bifunctional glutamate N-acetyltransferase/amino-acid acetyltransferase ArgJ [Desulfovibrio sp.]|nr:bifunctional glutamate N-acetyltransferase/amino-acid acetyltransferase ArgJ [Desulfovibrio sp.]